MKSILTLCFFIFISSHGYCQLEAEIDSIFAEYKNTPGCAVGIYSKGEILFKKGYGLANLDYDIEITPQTVFDIGSVSKQFTTACIVLLENQGKLSLDDDIRKYIPEIQEFEEGTVTIRHLLHHTSGLRDYLTLMYLSGMSFDDYFTEDMGLKILERQKALNFDPGSEYLYSNSGYLALAIIVRRVSGESIGEFAQKNIFEPLEMDHSFIYEDRNMVVKNRAIGYARRGEEFRRAHHFDFVLGGDGQVYTTVEDFFKWNENFKSNKLGDDTFIKKLLTRGILNNGDTLDYALGISHGVHKGINTIQHGGAGGGFRAFYVKFPDEDLGISVMSNYSNINTTQKAYQIADIILKDKWEVKEENEMKDVPKAEVPEIEFTLDQIAGYYEVEPGVELKIEIKNDSLHITQNWNQATYNIYRSSGNSFKIPGAENILFTFTDLKNDFIQTLTVFQGEEQTVCKRKEDHSSLDLNLEDYVGDYYSEELDVVYRVQIEEGTLNVQFENNDPSNMNIYNKDQFTCELGLMRFNRKDSMVSGFELDAGRVTNLSFSKN